MKKQLFFMAMLALLLISCGNKTQTDNKPTTETTVDASVTNTTDASVVNVYYFHGKQRCKTCLAIESVAKSTIEANYKDNPKVKFVEVNIDEAKDQALVEKYEVTFSSLIIAKGDNHTDLTEQAFANGVNSPDVLVGLMKDAITKNLD